jgi:hypothetical protein
MVKGLDKFKDHFVGFKGQYILIGGAACDLLHEDAGIEFRVTNDLDIVLCLEALDHEFVVAIWDFVRAGKYKRREKSSGKQEFFRFIDPDDASFPKMLELFSRRPDMLVVPDDQQVIPIPTSEDVSSLSAILLDDNYYHLVHSGAKEAGGLPVAREEHLILLKAKAYNNLRSQKESGQHVDENRIRKHKNDVFRLFRILAPNTFIELPGAIREDVRIFIDRMSTEEVDLKALKIRGTTKEAILAELAHKFGIELAD